MSYQFYQYWTRVVDFLLPPKCAGCKRSGQLLCDSCHANINWVQGDVCPSCGEPAPLGDLCQRCIKGPLHLKQIRSAVLFSGIIPKLIHQFKYNNIFALSEPLARLMYKQWERWSLETDYIIPVPLHQSRLRERGYNQSRLLAQDFARLVNQRVEVNLLTRVRQTEIQARLNAEERAANVSNAFLASDMVKSRRILLIDDVSTTGATLDSAAQALLKAGAKEVSAYCLARASKQKFSKVYS